LRDKRDAAQAFLRGYVEGLAYVRTHKHVTVKVIGRCTRQRDTDVLEKFYDDLVPNLPRVPYVEEASARATMEAIQSLGQPLSKVDLKALYDNGLLKGLEAEGLLDKIKFR
jgi:ABC-type nitrate/sulfonate/bicarbonate transport system substrate-binding protein